MTQIISQILLAFLGTFTLAFVTNWLALIPWRRSRSAHWTERARLLWPARTSATSNTIVVPGILYFLIQLYYAQETGPWFPLVLAGLAGTILGTLPMNREVFVESDSRKLLQNLASFWMLRLGVWFPLIAGIALMPDKFGWPALLITVLVLIFQCAFEFGLNLKLLKALKLLKPATPRLLQIVQQTSGKAQVRVKEVSIMAGSMAQAYALPTTNRLLFSERLLDICDDEEISAICAHELGHLTETKATLAGRLFGCLALFPWLFISPASNYLGIGGFLLIILLMFAILWFYRRLSLRMEKRADEIAKASELSDGVYARALEKIYRENLIPAVTPTRQRTHPDLYDRLLAAGFVPEYPRPKPPASQSWTGVVISMGLGLLVAALLLGKSIDRGLHADEEADQYINSLPQQNPQAEPFQLESTKPVSTTKE